VVRRVSIKDVAERAGVSWKTVSNVVNDRPVVKAATRDRVLAVIDELGYIPNRLGRDLRGGPTRTLSLVVPVLQNPYFARLAERMHVAAEKRGYTVSVEVSMADAEVERAHVFGQVGRPVDAVIISPSALDRNELLRREDGPRVVLLGEHLLGAKGVSHVAVDNVAAAADVVRHLTEEGYRAPIFLGAESRMRSTGTERLAGFRAASRIAGVEDTNARAIEVPDWTLEHGYEATDRVLDDGLAFDSVVAGNDLLAIGALAALREHGVDVPGQVGVVGWDDVPGAPYLSPPLSSIVPDVEALVSAALDAALTSDRAASSEHVVPHTLTVRDSSRRTG
jgi:DNA-binding LacI/PurR family transcriptional regulator